MHSNQPIISAIVAMTENRVIGKNNQMPWHLPADLRHFKTITMGHPILMGRKTFESIGKPLPGRFNIIMTRDPAYKADGCIVVTTIQDAIDVAQREQAKEIFIIGGAEIFKQLLPQVERIYLTIIHATLDGDTFFPELDEQMWEEVSRERHQADEKNNYDYSFLTLKKVILL